MSVPAVAFGTSISVVLFFVMSIREQVSLDALTGRCTSRSGGVMDGMTAARIFELVPGGDGG